MANITTQTIRVDLSTGKVIPTAYTHQNDTARTLVFDMYNGGLPYTMTGNTVKFAYKSPVVDGQYTVIAGSSMASGTVSGNKVTVTLPVAYTAISGVGLLTMIITPSSGTIRPVNIRLVVQKSADGDDVVAGASDFPDAWMDEKVYSWLDDHIDGIFTEEQFTDAVDNWLGDHPEATTTVQDGSITEGKLNSELDDAILEYPFYDEITYEKERHENTDCYIVTVPATDSDGNLIEPYVAYGNTATTPIVYAQENETTLTVNCQLAYYSASSQQFENAIVIGNGQVLTEKTFSDTVPSNLKYLGIKANRVLAEYDVNSTTSSMMLSDGCVNAFMVYCKLVDSGSAVDNSGITGTDGSSGYGTTPNPRMCMGVKSDGTWLFIACDGRTDINAGLTLAQLSSLLIEKGCINAWNFDGGGSVSMMVRGSKLNRNIDDDGVTDRVIHYTLNFKKTITKNGLPHVFEKISEEKQNTIQQIIPYVNHVDDRVTDLDTVINSHGTGNYGLTWYCYKIGHLVQLKISGNLTSELAQGAWAYIIPTLPYKPATETDDEKITLDGVVYSFIITVGGMVQVYPRTGAIANGKYMELTAHYICE